MPEIYFVRDSLESKRQVNAQVLVERINNNGQSAIYIETFDKILKYLEQNVKAGDLIVTMGAGDIWKVADEYIQWSRGNCKNQL